MEDMFRKQNLFSNAIFIFLIRRTTDSLFQTNVPNIITILFLDAAITSDCHFIDKRGLEHFSTVNAIENWSM